MKTPQNFLRLAIAVACTLTSLASPAQTESARATKDRSALSTLTGTYASTQTESWYGAYGTREFSFEKGRWSLKFVLALDPQMQAKVFEFRTHGPYYVGQPSQTVTNAFEAMFIEDAKFVTLLTRDTKLVQAFGLVACGLEVGVEGDVSIQGCANWKPVAVCKEDHDLLALGENGGLHFGERPRDNNMCTPDKRPKALLQAVARR
jgi:hypothetical protein